MSEAAIYSVPHAYAKHLAESGRRSGVVLLGFKKHISHPIAVILMFNTFVNSVGPALAGWLIASMPGADAGFVAGFSVVFTILILIFGEMIPKTAGVIFCRQISLFVALPLALLIRLFTPLIFVSHWIQLMFGRQDNQPAVSLDEVISTAQIGTEAGTLDHFEGAVISNVIGLDRVMVRDVMTPRVVVSRKLDVTKLDEVRADIHSWEFSRVPLFSEDDPDHLNSYVIQRDIYRALLKGQGELELRQIARPLVTVPELMGIDKLLLRMFEEREHICSVVDEHGALAGIITLEDIMEEVVGREIVDEYDKVSDMRATGRKARGLARSS